MERSVGSLFENEIKHKYLFSKIHNEEPHQDTNISNKQSRRKKQIRIRSPRNRMPTKTQIDLYTFPLFYTHKRERVKF